MIAADGFSNVDAEWLRNAIIFIAACLVCIYYTKKTWFDKTTSVRIEGTIASTKYVDTKHQELTESIKHLLTTEKFLIHHAHAEEEREELKEAIKDAAEKFERFTTDSYRSRRELHRRVNAHSNVLHFLAGQHQSGPEMRRILDRAEASSQGDEG
jgi:hypothetical protein